MTIARPRKYPLFAGSNERNGSMASTVNGSDAILPYLPDKSPNYRDVRVIQMESDT